MTSSKEQREQGLRLRAARLQARYKSARTAALENGWAESTYRAHESGTRTIGKDDAERYARVFRRYGVDIDAKRILFPAPEPETSIDPEMEPNSVRVMGYVGAGAEINPEFEQVPNDGLETIVLPFAIPEDVIAFRIRGESMLPTYRDGDAILVWKEQRLATEQFVGEEVAVRTVDGRRYLKELHFGQKKGHFNLYSSNASLISNVRLEWIGEIYIIVRASQIRRALTSKRSAETRKTKARKVETDGMDEMPFGRRDV